MRQIEGNLNLVHEKKSTTADLLASALSVHPPSQRIRDNNTVTGEIRDRETPL